MAIEAFRPPLTAAPDEGFTTVSGHSQARLRPLLVALFLLAVSAALAMQGLNMAAITAHAVLWDGLAMAAYGYGLLGVLLFARGPGYGLGSWRLGPWMMIWCGTMYGLATVTLSKPQTGPTAQIILADVMRALLLVAAGTTVWLAGYLVGPGHLIRNTVFRGTRALQRRFSYEIRSPFTPWLLYGVGSAARLATAATTSRLGFVGNAASDVTTASGYGQYLGLLSYCAPVGVAAAALLVFRQRSRAAWPTLSILFIAELCVAFVEGQKENFVVAVLAIAIPYTTARRRIPVALLASLSIVFLVVVIPFTQAYRDNARNATATLSTTEAASAAPQILRETLNKEESLLSVTPRSIGYLLQRSQDIDSPAIIIQRTPGQIAYSSPLQLITGPLTALIPRALWPGKPILTTGYQFGQQYYDFPATIYSSTTITPIGDLYRHGGWPSVILGMFFFGCGVRLLDDVLDIRQNPHMIFLLLFLFPSFVMSEQDWITLLAAVPGFILLWVLTVALAFRPKRELHYVR